jgi:hypothetical protein
MAQERMYTFLSPTGSLANPPPNSYCHQKLYIFFQKFEYSKCACHFIRCFHIVDSKLDLIKYITLAQLEILIRTITKFVICFIVVDKLSVPENASL